MALNTGDLLLGDGYRLIGLVEAPAEAKAEMLSVAADGHRRLCLGQGAELLWRCGRGPAVIAEVLTIFEGKTAPAFEVALLLGAVFAGADAGVKLALRGFSRALGVAYQIRDDLEDFRRNDIDAGGAAAAPNIILAAAWDAATDTERELLGRVWSGAGLASVRLGAIMNSTAAVAKAELLMEHHKNEALRALRPLENSVLKRLLHRIVGRVFAA